MAIETLCSGCGEKLAVSDEFAGRRARCPKCGQVYAVPHPTVSSAPSVSSAPTFPATQDAASTAMAGSNYGGLSSAESEDQFMMLAPDGKEYGPVTREKLNRWYEEGRVGADYKIRQGVGPWQPAQIFKSAPAANVNPYGANVPSPYPTAPNPYATSANSSQNPYSAARPYQSSYPSGGFAKTDNSGIILTMGILAWVVIVICPIFMIVFGLIAWVMGASALRDMQQGLMDPRNQSQVQVGYYLGISASVLSVICIGSYIVLVAVASVMN